MTSIAGVIAFAATSAYNALKFGFGGVHRVSGPGSEGLRIRVALVEPGIIDTAMATTNLPQYDENTIYSHGRRIHAFFTNPEKGEAPSALVGR